MTIRIKGELEIDQERGVIYFHQDSGITALRICSLPTPIPNPKYNKRLKATTPTMLDITHMYGCSWPPA